MGKAVGRLLGYARVSTEEQATDAQTDEIDLSRPIDISFLRNYRDI